MVFNINRTSFKTIGQVHKKAIRNETNAIDKFERRTFSKKEGMNIFILPPSKTIGIVPIKIDLNNFSCKRYSRNFLEGWLLKLKISFLKYQAMARTLPIWIVADKDAPGSSIPIKRDITFKWAVLLTGINSVKPCINPYKTNFKYSKIIKLHN